MRFIKALLTSAILTAVLTSCGNDNTAPSPSPTENTSPTPQATSVGEKMGDAAEDMADGAKKQLDDMADTTKKVADDVTK